MIKFEVGEPFHLPNPSPGQDFPLVRFNQSTFDICLYSVQALEDQKMITKESLKIYIYTSKNVPFVVFQFKDYTFDCSLNILKLKPEDAEEFISSDSNLLNIYLIDTFNNTLQGMRLLGLNAEIEKLIKTTLKKQKESFNTAEEVDMTINQIELSLSTDDMIPRAKAKQSFLRI